jgi:hypothetical protein
MAQKYLYVVDHFVDFPSSEYGGLWNVIAENDDECFDLISQHEVWGSSSYSKYFGKLRENIQKSLHFLLAENEESRVVESFTT